MPIRGLLCFVGLIFPWTLSFLGVKSSFLGVLWAIFGLCVALLRDGCYQFDELVYLIGNLQFRPWAFPVFVSADSFRD